MHHAGMGLAEAPFMAWRSSPPPNEFPPSDPNSHPTLSPACPPHPKGTIKPALQRLRERYAAKGRTLREEGLALEERADAGRELLTERAEENATLELQVGLSCAMCRKGWGWKGS